MAHVRILGWSDDDSDWVPLMESGGADVVEITGDFGQLFEIRIGENEITGTVTWTADADGRRIAALPPLHRVLARINRKFSGGPPGEPQRVFRHKLSVRRIGQ
jgi:hypothetical protein